MVKAATMAGAANRGGLYRKEVDVDGDYGMPLSSPELIIPIVALVLLVISAFIACLCKFFSCCCFQKKGRTKDLELQLGRHTRVSASLRKKSESLKSSSSGGGIRRSPSFRSSTRSRSDDPRTQRHNSSGGSGSCNKTVKVHKSGSSASRNHSNIARSNSTTDTNTRISDNATNSEQAQMLDVPVFDVKIEQLSNQNEQ